MENVTDTLFGTKYFTHGAEMQLPRKVPLRIEPKSYFGELRNNHTALWNAVRLSLWLSSELGKVSSNVQ